MLLYLLTHLAAYAIFGLVLFVFLGLMLLLGVFAMHSRWRSGWALAAVIAVSVFEMMGWKQVLIMGAQKESGLD